MRPFPCAAAFLPPSACRSPASPPSPLSRLFGSGSGFGGAVGGQVGVGGAGRDGAGTRMCGRAPVCAPADRPRTVAGPGRTSCDRVAHRARGLTRVVTNLHLKSCIPAVLCWRQGHVSPPALLSADVANPGPHSVLPVRHPHVSCKCRAFASVIARLGEFLPAEPGMSRVVLPGPRCCSLSMPHVRPPRQVE